MNQDLLTPTTARLLPGHANGPADGNEPPLIGVAALARIAFSGGDLAPVGASLLARAQADPSDCNAWLDLSTTLLLSGHPDAARAVQRQALAQRQVYRQGPARPTIRLLAILGPGDLMANTPLEFLLEDSDVAMDMLYLMPDGPLPDTLPPHDVLFVAIGESDENHALLAQAEVLAARSARPVINAPAAIRQLGRDTVSRMLRTAPGLAMPPSMRIARGALLQLGFDRRALSRHLPGMRWPVIARPVGSHAGQGLCKLEGPGQIADYVARNDANEFYLTPFVDYQGADGLYRKYRVVLIEGRPFACHMAISSHWMVHYLNAGMTDSAAKRDEEARFMRDFDADFARRHTRALTALAAQTGLHYLGLDCAETPLGELLVFEADTAIVVHAMDPVEVFPYKREPMRRLFAAFRDMLRAAARRPDVEPSPVA
jgi:hypothetical protein